MVRYIDISQTLCDAMFATFLVSWFITRHVLFNLVIWSTIHDLPVTVGFKWVPEEGRYLTMGSHLMFCIFLVALQVRIFDIYCIPSTNGAIVDYTNGVVCRDLQSCMESYLWKRSR